MTRDILFDLGNVLVPVNWERAFQRLGPHLPLEMAGLLKDDRSAFVALFRKPAIALESGKMGFTEFHGVMSGILGIDMNEEDFHFLWCDVFTMDKAMVALGESLSNEYGTWLMSNTSEAHYDWIIKKFPRVAFFKDAALSFELGVMKPATRYYKEAISKFGIDPSTAVFIDDLEENVDGAIRAGINGILFQGLTPLLQDLRKLGVNLPD
ncbi:MAG: HAD family phosphatase [Desulfomonile tiedjei]|nr:HAD family phosphatase [Desulfomonile tiedjei]